jgi:mRNA interferase MazF
MIRGAIWWAELPDPVASEPGYRRPVLIIQSNAFNRSRIHTVIAVVITANLRLAEAPGNVRLAARESGLPKDSVGMCPKLSPWTKRFWWKSVGKWVRERCVLLRRGCAWSLPSNCAEQSAAGAAQTTPKTPLKLRCRISTIGRPA